MYSLRSIYPDMEITINLIRTDKFVCVYFKIMLENRNINNIDVFAENKRVAEIVLLLLRTVLHDCKMQHLSDKVNRNESSRYKTYPDIYNLISVCSN